MRRATAFVIAVLAFVGVTGQYFLNNATKTGPELASSTVNFFSYFTILSNLFVVVALMAYLVAPMSRVGRFFGGPRGATPVAFYITITGLVFWLVLRDTIDPKGLGIGLNAIHHYIVPVVFPLWWLFFVRKGELRLGDVINWMIFPAIYALYTILHGQESGFYPYGFVNVTKLGLDGVIHNMVKFGLQFAILGCLYVLVDRVIGYVASRQRGVPLADAATKPVVKVIAVPPAPPAVAPPPEAAAVLVPPTPAPSTT